MAALQSLPTPAMVEAAAMTCPYWEAHAYDQKPDPQFGSCSHPLNDVGVCTCPSDKCRNYCDIRGKAA